MHAKLNHTQIYKALKRNTSSRKNHLTVADEHKNPEIKTIYKAGGKHVRVSGSGMSGVADAAAPAYKKPAHIKKDARLEDAGLVESGLG